MEAQLGGGAARMRREAKAGVRRGIGAAASGKRLWEREIRGIGGGARASRRGMVVEEDDGIGVG